MTTDPQRDALAILIRDTMADAVLSSDWLREVKEQAWREGHIEGFSHHGAARCKGNPNSPHRQEASNGHPCGDHPAPCNCDDPETHGGHR